MVKNKRKFPNIEETLARPWCYYCERDFDDLKILINHQKAKHFKCERCGRRLNTAGGLSVHMTQVHKETLTVIENALPNRSGLEVEIFGMEGIPEDIVQSHNQRVLQSFAQAEAERRAATGNAGQDGAASGAMKKPKFESPSDLKKRLAEHKAKKAADEAAGIGSGSNTPAQIGLHGDNDQSPGAFAGAGSPNYLQQPTPFTGPPGNPAFPPQSQPYGQHPGPQPSPFQPPSQQQSQFQPPSQQPPFRQQQLGFGHQGMPQYPNNQPFAAPPQFQPPVLQGFQPQFSNAPPQFQGPPPHFQNGQGPPPYFQNGPPLPYHGGQPQGPPHFHNGPPQPYGAGSPPPFQQSQFQPPRHGSPQQPGNQSQPPHHATPPLHGGMPQRPGSLPAAPGLPQRPTFGAPPVNAVEMQQMHQGQLKGPTNQADQSYNAHQNGHPNNSHPGSQAPQAPTPNPLLEPSLVLSANASSLDDLVSGAAKDADKAADPPLTKAQVSKMATPVEEKKSKKDKDKSKLVYSDNEVSPEEKMAQLPRYAFVPAV